MLRVFGQTDKAFTSNGDIVLQPLKAKVHKEDNGDYYLDLTAGLEYLDYLTNGNIVVADTPQGSQAFRVTNPEKTKSKINAKAWHVFYDTKNYLVQNESIEDYSPMSALNTLNISAEPQSPFTVFSDVSGSMTYTFIRESLYNGIMRVVSDCGGHLVRDNFSIRLMNEIGQDVGVTIEYAKNIKDITCEENWDNVVTRLLPTGKDDIMLNSLVSTIDPYVYAPIQYDIPYVKTVSFTQDHIKSEDYETETAYKQALINDLRIQARSYVVEYSKPRVNYTLKAHMDKLTDIGDVVHVKDKRLGIDLLANVISFEYDCISKKYTEVEFGNFKPTLSGLVSNITSSVYPVGTVYMSVNNSDPSSVLGGTWQSITNDLGLYMWKRVL